MKVIFASKKTFTEEELLKKAKDMGIFSKYPKVIALADGNILPYTEDNARYARDFGRSHQVENFTLEADNAPAKETQEKGKSLHDMKKAELIAYAEELGVDLTKATNNDMRIDAIQAHLENEEGK